MAYILGLATGILSAFWIWFIDNGKGGQEMKYDDLRKQRDLTAAVSAAVGKLLICTTKTEAYETKKEIENRLFDLYSFKLKTIDEGGISKW